jgi:hypothetical protein
LEIGGRQLCELAAHLPHIDAAFVAGRLSFDGVRQLSRVATAEDEDLWLDIAASESGAQLARICRACRRVLDLDTPQPDQEQLRRRGVWTHFEDDGMLSLRALLLPEEGALVHAAMEVAVREAKAANAAPPQSRLVPRRRLRLSPRRALTPTTSSTGPMAGQPTSATSYIANTTP